LIKNKLDVYTNGSGAGAIFTYTSCSFSWNQTLDIKSLTHMQQLLRKLSNALKYNWLLFQLVLHKSFYLWLRLRIIQKRQNPWKTSLNII